MESSNRAVPKPKDLQGVFVQEAVMVLLLLTFGAGLRLLSLSGEAPWPDEIYATLLLDQPFGEYLGGLSRYYPSMTPVYYTLLYGWAALFGQSISTLRLLSVAAGVWTIFVVYLITRRMYGRGAAALAGFLVAVIAMHVQYSQEIAPYALAWLLTAWSALSFIYWLEKPSACRLLMHTACNVAMMFTHLFTVMALPAYLFALAVMTARSGAEAKMIRQGAHWLALQALPCIMLGLWVSWLDSAALDAGFGWVPGVGMAGVSQMVGWYTGAGGFQVRETVPYWLHLLDPILKALCVAVFLLLVWPLVAVAIGRTPPYLRAHTGEMRACKAQLQQTRFLTASYSMAFTIAWLVAPVVGLVLVSLLYRPAFVARYVGYASFGAYWALAGILCQVPSRTLRAWLTALVVALFSLQAVVLGLSRPIRSDWYGVADHVEAIGPVDAVYANVHGVVYALNAASEKKRKIIVCDNTSELMEHLLQPAATMPGWVLFDPLFGDWSAQLEDLLHAQGRKVTRTHFAGRYEPLVVLRVE